MAGRRASRAKIWASGVSASCIQVLLTVKFNVNLGSFGAHPILPLSTTLYFNDGWLHSEMDQNLGLVDKYLAYIHVRYFWAVSVQGHSEVVRYTSEFCDSWQNCTVVNCPFWFTWWFRLLSVQGQFEVIRCIFDFRQPCISKRVGHRAKRTKIWATWARMKYIQNTFD